MKNLLGRLPRLRISTFIGILHLVIAIIGAGVISGFALYFIYHCGEQSNLHKLEGTAFILANALEEPLAAAQDGSDIQPTAINHTLEKYFAANPDYQFTILSPDGSTRATSSNGCLLEGITANWPEVQQATQNTFAHSVRTCPNGVRMMLAAVSIWRGSTLEGILVMAVPFHSAMAATYRTMGWMGLVALFIILVTVLEGWLGGLYISKPVADLSHVAEQYSQGNLQSRAALNGPLEVVHLAQTFNAMAARLQNSLDSMRTFVANASHELRTPLTTLKLQVGALQSGACEDPEVAHHFLNQIESEVDRLTHSVNEMLDLSQIEGGSHPQFQPIDLKELASEALAFWETRLRHANISVNFTCEPNLPKVSGEPFQLRRLFDNLLDNAIKNTPTCGSIEIAIRRCPKLREVPQQNGVQIRVHDTGFGIAAEHLPYIFDRFYRIDHQPASSRSAGSGLGLAIAHSIVRHHGGEISVESQSGAGTTFTVLLPTQ